MFEFFISKKGAIGLFTALVGMSVVAWFGLHVTIAPEVKAITASVAFVAVAIVYSGHTVSRSLDGVKHALKGCKEHPKH